MFIYIRRESAPVNLGGTDGKKATAVPHATAGDKYYFATRPDSLARQEGVAQERNHHQEAKERSSLVLRSADLRDRERAEDRQTDREKERKSERKGGSSKSAGRAKVHPLVHLARAYLHAVCAE